MPSRAKTKSRAQEKPSALPPDYRPPLTLAQVAIYLNVSERYVRRLIEGKKIPSYFYANRRYVDPADLDAWMAEQRDGGRATRS